MFRKWREDNVRCSEQVVGHWKSMLAARQHKLGKEQHLILEQVLIPALDVNELDLGRDLIEQLQEAFPTSKRVTKYKVMLMEAAEHYDKAHDLLEKLTASDISNAAPRKRFIALHKANNNIDKAIAELCAYLKE